MPKSLGLHFSMSQHVDQKYFAQLGRCYHLRGSQRLDHMGSFALRCFQTLPGMNGLEHQVNLPYLVLGP